MSAFDFSADRIELKSIVNRLKKKISARKKFLLIIVHESVGMKWELTEFSNTIIITTKYFWRVVRNEGYEAAAEICRSV